MHFCKRRLPEWEIAWFLKTLDYRQQKRPIDVYDKGVGREHRPSLLFNPCRLNYACLDLRHHFLLSVQKIFITHFNQTHRCLEEKLAC